MDGRKLNKKELGMVGTKKCQRCQEYFYPNNPQNIYCPWCAGKAYPIRKEKCKISDCDELVGKGSRGLCPHHYSSLFVVPRRKYLLAMKRVGVKICATYQNCDIFFVPKSKKHWGIQKYCDYCTKNRASLKNKHKDV